MLAAPVLPATLGGTPRREGAACDHAPREEWPVAADDGREGGRPASPGGPVMPAGFPDDCGACLVLPAVPVCAAPSPSSDATSAIRGRVGSEVGVIDLSRFERGSSVALDSG